jgi:hydroxyacylglutathione hydrolase
MLAEGVHWFDDWFAIETVAPGVTAIGEPRFHQINWNYLVEGDTGALLFDTGPGVRDISVVVQSLTAKPLTVLPSHLHFDHTGNLHRFADVALADLPELRACVEEGVLNASDDLFRGFLEGMVWKPVRISRWWKLGQVINLGGRALELLHTPGHTNDSVSLFDPDSNLLLAADFIYLGPLYAQVPGSNLAAYLNSAENLLSRVEPQTAIYGAHGQPDAQGKHRAPRLGRPDVSDLAASLSKLKTSGIRPKTWPVNERMSLRLSERAFAPWQSV